MDTNRDAYIYAAAIYPLPAGRVSFLRDQGLDEITEDGDEEEEEEEKEKVAKMVGESIGKRAARRDKTFHKTDIDSVLLGGAST